MQFTTLAKETTPLFHRVNEVRKTVLERKKKDYIFKGKTAHFHLINWKCKTCNVIILKSDIGTPQDLIFFLIVKRPVKQTGLY